MLYPTRQTLDNHLATFAAAPKNQAQVEHLCIRPCPGKRQVVDRVILSPSEGVVGDRWKTQPWLRLPDGSPDPRIQVSLCSPRLLAILSSDIDPKLAIGDNIITDLDFSEANLPVGQRLRIGEAIIEVSDVYNDACTKFAQRFGADTFRWIRETENRAKRLRGIFARVIQGGEVRRQDYITKELSSADSRQ